MSEPTSKVCPECSTEVVVNGVTDDDSGLHYRCPGEGCYWTGSDPAETPLSETEEAL